MDRYKEWRMPTMEIVKLVRDVADGILDRLDEVEKSGFFFMDEGEDWTKLDEAVAAWGDGLPIMFPRTEDEGMLVDTVIIFLKNLERRN